MQSQFCKLNISNLKAQLELLRLESQSLANHIEAALTFQERANLSYRWAHTSKQSRAIQYMLDRLEEREREADSATCSPNCACAAQRV